MMGPACYVQVNHGLGGNPRVLPIAPMMLFLGESEADEPDTAARDAALDLGQRLERPVLLLDLGNRALGQYDHFADARVLAPRAMPMPPASGQAAWHFHPLQESNLFVSSLMPGSLANDDGFWERRIAQWPDIRRRLLDLFGAIVVAAPSLARSRRALLLADRVDASVLVLRESEDVAARAELLRTVVERRGGRAAGVVLTGCRRPVIEQSVAGRRWW